MDRIRARGRSGAALVLFGLVSLGACESSTAVGVTRDVATSLSITVSGGDPGRDADPLLLEVGDTITLAAIAKNPLGLAIPAGTVAWSSSNTSVVDIEASGLVRAVGVGSADIQAASGEAATSVEAVVDDSSTFAATGG